MKEYKLSEILTIKNGRDYKNLKNGLYPVYGSGGLMCKLIITFMSAQVFCYLEKERYLIYSLPILLFGLSILFITLKLTVI